MLTGQALFRGSPAEVMHQHQHAPLSLEQLEDVPQPLVVLLRGSPGERSGAAFSKPGRTFESDPGDNRVPSTQRRKITRQSLRRSQRAIARRNPQAASETGTEEDFSRKIAHYRKRRFRSRGGCRFPG